MSRGEARQVLFRQLEEFYSRAQAPAVFCVRWVFEIFLQMHERARSLNQSFKKIIIVGVAIEPNLLQNVVRLVVTLLVPAAKKPAIKWMGRYVAGRIDLAAFELADKLRNPLAFAHGGLNFIMPQMMGKPTFPEGHESSPRRVRPLADIRDRSQE